MAETSNEQTPEWSPTMLLRGDMEHPKHSGRYLVGVDEESYAEALAEIDRQREEIESLRSELWKVAECIWQNVHSDDAKHWARGIMVTLRPSAPPSFAVETTTELAPRYPCPECGEEQGHVAAYGLVCTNPKCSLDHYKYGRAPDENGLGDK